MRLSLRLETGWEEICEGLRGRRREFPSLVTFSTGVNFLYLFLLGSDLGVGPGPGFSHLVPNQHRRNANASS